VVCLPSSCCASSTAARSRFPASAATTATMTGFRVLPDRDAGRRG
jgi:hypothetical protein